MDEQLTRWMFDPLVRKGVTALLGVALLFAIHRLLRRTINRRVEDNAARYRARKLATFSAYLVGLLFLTAIFSSQFAAVTVVLGVVSAGVALSLQKVIASVAGWVAISFGKFYSPGDRVQIGAIKGDVIDVSVLRTTLMEVGQWVSGDLYNGRIVRIANSAVFEGPIFNYSADFPFVWDEITLPVRYGSDWKAAKTMLAGVADEICREYALQSREAWLQVVKQYRLEEARVEPMVTMVANDNWLEFTLRYIVDYRKRRLVKDQLFTRVLEEIDASGDRIRLASATFEVVNLPKLDLAFANGEGEVRARYVP